VDREALLQRFGLRPGLPVVLISAGAAGGAYTTQVVAQTLRMTSPFQAVVVCGRNAELKAAIQAQVAAKADSYKVLGYTNEMADLMRVSSLFVGKPGGLSSSECMAVGLPMVIINPIPGQEVRNSDYLLEEGAAVRCNYATTVGLKIDQLLADPERLARLAANAARVGRPDAGRDVAQKSLAETGEPLWISRDAQRSMLVSGEQGVAASDLDDARRLRTLRDVTTGRSLAVVTQGQLAVLGAREGATSIHLALPLLNALRWQPENFDLATTGRWLLGPAEERRVALD
jgi:processive 1,2-diacylglycerol beta-glucosyltransferase